MNPADPIPKSLQETSKGTPDHPSAHASRHDQNHRTSPETSRNDMEITRCKSTKCGEGGGRGDFCTLHFLEPQNLTGTDGLSEVAPFPFICIGPRDLKEGLAVEVSRAKGPNRALGISGV